MSIMVGKSGTCHVRLSPYPNHWGTKTEISGQELPDVGDIHLDCPVDELPKLTVTMNATNLDVELDAHVDLHFHVEEGYNLFVEKRDDGTWHVRSERR